MPEILLYAFAAWVIASFILAPIIGHFIAFGMGTREDQEPPPNRARPEQADRSNHR
jgi:hypothetical protein